MQLLRREVILGDRLDSLCFNPAYKPIIELFKIITQLYI